MTARLAKLLFLCIFCTAALHSEEVNLTIFTLNDVYEILPRDGWGGVSEMMTLLRKERENTTHYMTTLNGDFLSPSLISNLFQGSEMIEVMNMMEVDVVVFGNHEFDYGKDVLIRRIEESNFSWLGSNILGTHRGASLSKAKPTLVFEIDGISFGMLGIVTPETAELASDLSGVTFAPIVISAQAAVHQLKRAGADVIIALTHLSMEEDLYLARSVPEIDVILGGHDHDVMTFYDGKTLIHKSGHDAQFLGRVDLKVEKKRVGNRDKIAIYPEWKMFSNHNLMPDPEMYTKVKVFAEKIDRELDQPLFTTLSSLDSTNVRIQETTMGNFIADAMRVSLNADIALINGGAIRGNCIYPPGTVLTKKDIQKELPFGNIAVLVEATGKDIYTAIENGLKDVEHKSGGFLQVSGIKYHYNPDANPGSRVTEISVGNRLIEKNTSYRVAMTDYLLKGGDGNHAFSRSKIVIGPGGGNLEARLVIDYAETLGEVTANVEGRIQRIDIQEEIKKTTVDGKRIHLNSE